MQRRQLIATGALVGAGWMVSGRAAWAMKRPRPFGLRFAPHFGMFKHHAGDDPIDQLRFMHDQGFVALEDNGRAKMPVELQEKIAKESGRLGLTMGVFVSIADFSNVTFASDKDSHRDKIIADAHQAVEVAKRANAKWNTIVPGCFDTGLQWGYQTAYVIDNLKRVAEIYEKAGIVGVLEPLNPWRDHPGLFLTKIAQAYQICRAVGSPSIKILFDMYHQQVTEGNIIPNLDRAWPEVAYLQVGDNPGRKEPTTGELNYKNIFAHIKGKGFKGIVGMEHGNANPGKAGEMAVIKAYRQCDPA